MKNLKRSLLQTLFSGLTGKESPAAYNPTLEWEKEWDELQQTWKLDGRQALGVRTLLFEHARKLEQVLKQKFDFPMLRAIKELQAELESALSEYLNVIQMHAYRAWRASRAEGSCPRFMGTRSVGSLIKKNARNTEMGSQIEPISALKLRAF